MSEAPTIRAATPHDADAISALAMRSKAYWGYSASFMEACREELTVTPEQVRSGDLLYVVAENKSRLLGYYAIEKMAEYEYELEALFVEPAYIGQGVGRSLIMDAIGAVSQRGGNTLLVQSDPNAEEFYRAAGGTLIGERESTSIPGRGLPLFAFEICGDGIAPPPH